MFSQIMEINRLLRRYIIPIYLTDLLVGIAYIVRMWSGGYYMGVGLHYTYIYSVLYGAVVVLDAILLQCALKQRIDIFALSALKFRIMAQFVMILTDIPFAFISGRFFIVGYIFMLYELSTVAAFMCRYSILNYMYTILREKVL